MADRSHWGGAPRWRALAVGVFRQLTRGRATFMAGGVAFYGFLALFPAMFALFALYGLVADPHDVEAHMNGIGRLLPLQIREPMQTELLAQVGTSGGTLGIELVASLMAAVWSATSGTEALMIAIAGIHDHRESRSRVRVTATALLLTLAAIVSGAIALGAIVAVTLLGARHTLSTTVGHLATWLRWPVLATILALALAVLYRYAVPRASTKRQGVSAGSLIAASLWLCGSSLFSWVVADYTNFTRLDGSIAAITVMLTWFLMSAYIVILGAAIDVERGRLPPHSLADRAHGA
jgi:membrane protein